jgi:hypothetical protein
VIQNVSRPWPLALINKFGSIAGKSRKLTVDELIHTARRKSGLHDFNDDSFVQPLEQLLYAIHHEANLHLIGRMITKIRLVNVLMNRLRVEEYIRKYPECMQQELDPVVLVTGLQRTGTTKLHRLLAADPDTRFLTSWETLNPVPLKKQDNSDRIRAAKTSEKALKYMSPRFFAIHPVEYDAPEEEVLLLDMSFLSTIPEATMHVPSFARWASSQDQTPAYAYLKKAVLVLQHQSRRQRWVMKSPHHLEFLKTFLKVFPDTKLVQTHRHPRETLASFCSMVYHSRSIFSDALDPDEIGRHWSEKAATMLDNAMKDRKEIPSDSVVDIFYYDLVSDSVKQLDRIYHMLGIPLSNEKQDRMRQAERNNHQHKYGIHRYQLEDFGLSEESIERRFDKYITRFGLHKEFNNA